MHYYYFVLLLLLLLLLLILTYRKCQAGMHVAVRYIIVDVVTELYVPACEITSRNSHETVSLMCYTCCSQLLLVKTSCVSSLVCGLVCVAWPTRWRINNVAP